MVADKVVGSDVGLSRSLTPRQLEFGRLLVCEGKTACDAYRLAYSYSGPHADTLSDRLHRRADMQAYLAELREEAKQSGLLDMRERRGLLARIVRHEQAPIDPPTYAERMKAAELDAKFTGESRSDGVNIALNGPVSIDVVLNQLRNAEHNRLDNNTVNPPYNPPCRPASGSTQGQVVDVESVDGTYQQGGPPVVPGVGPQDGDGTEAVREPSPSNIPKTAGNVKKGSYVKSVKGVSSSGESGNGDSGGVVSPVIVRGPLGVLGG